MKMSKRNLLNLGLLLFIGVLVLLVIYEPGIETPKESPSLLDTDREAIKQIHIERQGQETVELVRNESGKWLLTAPLSIDANDFRITSLLRITEQKSLGSRVWGTRPATLPMKYIISTPNSEHTEKIHSANSSQFRLGSLPKKIMRLSFSLLKNVFSGTS